MNSQSKFFESVLSSSLMLINCIGRGFTFNRDWTATPRGQPRTSDPNPLRTFFNARKEGRGIWKWDHYFDIYDRHFRGFRGREVHVLEIGVYSGGSLDMWREYFGPSARLYGVDIEPACKSYESEAVKIFIGDQSDRNFWHRFRAQVPALDIVVDDGGHHPEQQIATFEELLPHLRPGGVFLCEDVHGVFNPFTSYMHGVTHKLNDFEQARENTEDMHRRISCPATPFQAAVGSVHFYPFVTVVERNATPITELVAPKHGTQWQPHLK